MNSIFDILIRRRVPLRSAFLHIIIVICLSIAGLFFWMLATAERFVGQSGAGWAIGMILDFWTIIPVVAVIVFAIITPLYYKARVHRPAQLIIEQERIFINGKKIKINLATRQIRTIFVNDLKNAHRDNKEQLQVVLIMNSGARTTFRLAKYYEGEDLIDVLSALKHINFHFYEDDAPSEHYDD